MLDFPFFRKGREFASSSPTDNLRTLFEEDDWFTDADSNAYQLPTFLGNHRQRPHRAVRPRRQPGGAGVRAAAAGQARA